MNAVDLTLVEARAALRSGALGCVEYAQALLAQCVAGASLHAWISQDPEALLRAAAAVDGSGAARDDTKPLAGLPLALKDNINTVSLPTSGGTRALLGRTPPADAPLATALFEAGALLAGKTNLHARCAPRKP